MLLFLLLPLLLLLRHVAVKRRCTRKFRSFLVSFLLLSFCVARFSNSFNLLPLPLGSVMLRPLLSAGSVWAKERECVSVRDSCLGIATGIGIVIRVSESPDTLARLCGAAKSYKKAEAKEANFSYIHKYVCGVYLLIISSEKSCKSNLKKPIFLIFFYFYFFVSLY